MFIYIHTLCMLIYITYTYIYYKHISTYSTFTDKGTRLLEVGKGSPEQINSIALAIRFLIFPSLRAVRLL